MPGHGATVGDDGPAPLSDELQHLASLGYTDYADDESGPSQPPPGERGVVHVDRDRSSAGYGLYSSIPHGLAALIDDEGRELRTWRSGARTRMSRAILLANGDLAAICMDAEGAAFLQRWSWSGKPRWRVHMNAHHDLQELPDGRLALLSWRHIAAPEVDETVPVRDDLVTIVSARGEVLEQHSVWEMLLRSPAHMRDMLARVQSSREPAEPFVDFFHANSVQVVGPHPLAGDSPLYAPSAVAIALRRQDAVAIFDGREGRLLWLFGPGELEAPHEARVLPNGNVLCFDNGARGRGYSRVVEIDPRTNRITWQFVADPPKDFYSRTRGTSQLLSNGNVLVSHSSHGRAFEVDREGEVVWRFLNPHRNRSGRPGTLRMLRYPPERIEPLLDDR